MFTSTLITLIKAYNAELVRGHNMAVNEFAVGYWHIRLPERKMGQHSNAFGGIVKNRDQKIFYLDLNGNDKAE